MTARCSRAVISFGRSSLGDPYASHDRSPRNRRGGRGPSDDKPRIEHSTGPSWRPVRQEYYCGALRSVPDPWPYCNSPAKFGDLSVIALFLRDFAVRYARESGS